MARTVVAAVFTTNYKNNVGNIRSFPFHLILRCRLLLSMIFLSMNVPSGGLVHCPVIQKIDTILVDTCNRTDSINRPYLERRHGSALARGRSIDASAFRYRNDGVESI